MLAKIKEVPVLMVTTLVILTIFCLAMGVMLIPAIRTPVFDMARDAILVGTDYARLVFEKAGLQ